MKKLLRASAALLAVVCLAGCSLVEVNEDRVIVAQVGDLTVTLTEFIVYAVPYLNYNEISPYDSSQKEQLDQLHEYLLEMMVREKITQIKTEELGIAETAEDRQKAEEDAAAYLDQMYQTYYNAYITQEGADEAQVAADAEAYVAGMFDESYTREDYVNDTVAQLLAKRLIETSTPDVVVTEEEIRASYDEKVQAAKDEAAKGLASFETYMGTEDPFYVPDGYYYVKHILIAFEDGIAQEINSLRTEDKADEANSIREANLALIQARADEALAKVQEEGSDFDALIEEYGDDPGMKSEPYMSEGYLMYEGNEGYMDEFYEGSLLLTQDGDVSGLVATDYGYHIIKRASTLASYTKDYDEAKVEIEETLLSTKRNEAYEANIETWKVELNVKTWPKRIEYPVQ